MRLSVSSVMMSKSMHSHRSGTARQREIDKHLAHEKKIQLWLYDRNRPAPSSFITSPYLS